MIKVCVSGCRCVVFKVVSSVHATWMWELHFQLWSSLAAVEAIMLHSLTNACKRLAEKNVQNVPLD